MAPAIVKLCLKIIIIYFKKLFMISFDEKL